MPLGTSDRVRPNTRVRSRGTPGSNPGERLECACRRDVLLAECLNDSEGISEQRGEALRGLPRDGKPRAVIGPIRCERRDEDRPRGCQCRAQGRATVEA